MVQTNYICFPHPRSSPEGGSPARAGSSAVCLQKTPVVLNVSYVCPEPVLANQSFVSIEWHNKCVFHTEWYDSEACVRSRRRADIPREPWLCAVPICTCSNESCCFYQDRLRTNTVGLFDHSDKSHSSRPIPRQTVACYQ
jgi:hypothetical protein